jgi:sugar phosphate isomerase/epimerase
MTAGGADPEARVVAAMELAADLGCPLVKSFGGAFPDDHPASAVIDHVAAAANRLADHARRTGVGLVIETHDGFCRGETLAAVLARVPDDGWVGALWDVHHPYRMGESVETTDALIGARVRHVHVKDALRAGDAWSFVRLGEGELPVQPMLTALAARGYDGYVAVDWEKLWHPEIEDPETVLPHYAETLRRYLRSCSVGVRRT